MKPGIKISKRYSARNASVITVLLLLIYLIYINKETIQTKYQGSRINHDSGGDSTKDKTHTFTIKEIHFRPLDEKTQSYGSLQVTPEFVNMAKSEFEQNVAVASGDNEDLYDKQLWSASIKSNPWTHQFTLKQGSIKMKRMVNRDPDYVESFLDYAHENPEMARKVHLDWVDETVLAPNVTDKETVISLALMSSNAYVRLPYEGDWRNLSDWNNDLNPDLSVGIGWDSDGVRGHIFSNDDSSVIVIALKGTSAQGLPGSGEDETTDNDKLNDNVLFSCCCARVSYLWKTACDCYVKSYTCDEKCLEQELVRKDRYYQAVLDIYRSAVTAHPNSAIWITGHSLGGALASLLGRTFGAPAVAFEAPGELLATKRLHLPMPPGLPAYQEGVWHIGHTADPIFMGTCNGASSSCSIAGYAMETSCHSGKVCVYDVVTDKGWHVNMLNHRIHTVIDGILTDYDTVAKCKTPDACHDCFNWNYVKGRDVPKKHKSSSSTASSTSAETSTLTVGPSPPEKTTTSCIGRNWIGICTEYGI